MPRKARLKSGSGVYHVILRGANRQEIFHDDEDCMQFLNTLERYKNETELKVYGWCLMSNHVHLLLREGNEELSKTMKRIGVSFVRYYNWKYGVIGHLFQDRFKSESVETREYLLTVVRYIHQNPLKAGIVKKVNEWRWSSCHGYYSKSYYPMGLLDYNFILQFFSSDPLIAKERFKEFNERNNNDECLEERTIIKRRLTDEEAREKIKEVLGDNEITQVKSLPKLQRNELLRRVKGINGLSQRQTARILGVSPRLICKA
ncbi:REP-associated tyrosine transposase [Bacillus sp. Marseille-P3661]|uniref:REP-associated tyrosine transposase n=1 Tax=Bacillus sp. Marseille-P3661 TaxID=1936234 RepID=UPI000C829D6C|nr:transposase [Bacillus sp. Marseille-P3661]